MTDWVVWYSQQIWWLSVGMAIGLPLGIILSKWRTNEKQRRVNTRPQDTSASAVSEKVGMGRGYSMAATDTPVHMGTELDGSNTNSNNTGQSVAELYVPDIVYPTKPNI